MARRGAGNARELGMLDDQRAVEPVTVPLRESDLDVPWVGDEDVRALDESLDEALQDAHVAPGRDLAALVARLPPRDQDALWLRYTLHKTEWDIGVVMGLTQAGVAYRLQRASWRLRTLARYPLFAADELAEGGAIEVMLVRSVFWAMRRGDRPSTHRSEERRVGKECRL